MTQGKEFGRLLTQARWARGWTRTQAADAIGVSEGFYGVMETGAKLPSLMTFARMHRVLGLDANAVLNALPLAVRSADPRRRRGVPRLQDIGGRHAAFVCVLARARDEAGLTQASVARAVMCSRRHIPALAAGCDRGQHQRVEDGAELPSMVVAARLHQVLRFDANAALRAVWLADRMIASSR